jgi:hypothetical protein
MAGFWTFLALCLVGGALLPARWGLRVVTLLVLPGATVWLLAPTPQFWDVGPLDGLGQFLATTILLALLAGFGLRWLMERVMAGRQDPPPAVDEKETRDLLSLADATLAAVAGLCAGPFLALALALALRGSPGGAALHVAVAALATALAALSLRWTRGLLRPLAVVAWAVLAAAALLGALLGALRWPALIEARAAETAEGAPFCLRSGDRLARPEETMLLTLPRGRPGSPGLILTVTTLEGPRSYRWSYRARDFVAYGAYAHGPCPEEPTPPG